MPIIKLTECITVETDKIKHPWNNVYWSEWSTRDIYINTNKIITFTKCTEYKGVGKDYICNDENFNTLIEIEGTKNTITLYVQETPQQIIKLINKKNKK